MNEFYRLDENRNAIPCSTSEWMECREKMRLEKKVAQETVNGKWISTVWLGIASTFNHEGKPNLYLTSVLDDDNLNSIHDVRHATWDEAEKGHQKAVQWVKDGCKSEGEMNE